MSTAIEWTDDTVNPIRAVNVETGKTGWFCTRVSAGCKFCYAATMNGWRGNGVDYAEDQAKKVQMFLDHSVLDRVLRWRKGRKIFWCDMTDMFHPLVEDKWLSDIFAVMAMTRRHTHQILTKRPERMLEWMKKLTTMTAGGRTELLVHGYMNRHGAVPVCDTGWQFPLTNLWCGTSIEDQETANQRIPVLLQVPGAAVRWVSYEPALGPVDFSHIRSAPDVTEKILCPGGRPYNRVDWVVIGGESGGQDARQFDIAWARQTIAQCRKAVVPIFVKQLGRFALSREQSDFPIFSELIDHESKPTGEFALDAHGKHGDPAEWPPDIRVREFPRAIQ